MARVLVRLLMAVVGLGVVLAYAAAAGLVYVLVAAALADPPGLATLALVFGLVAVVGGYASYRFGTARLLGGLRATELSRSRAPELHRRLDGLADAMDVRRPPLLVGDLGVPNALSIGGPRRGVVVLDRRLFRLLTVDELEGILAHELAHLERYDTFVQTLSVSVMHTVVGFVYVLFLPLLLMFVGVARAGALFLGRPGAWRTGIAARFGRSIELFVGLLLSVLTLAVLAYSRRREFAADDRAAEVTGDPIALARALAKIHDAATPAWSLRSMITIHGDEREGVGRYLSTHPPIEERVEHLLEGTAVRNRRGPRVRP